MKILLRLKIFLSILIILIFTINSVVYPESVSASNSIKPNQTKIAMPSLVSKKNVLAQILANPELLKDPAALSQLLQDREKEQKKENWEDGVASLSGELPPFFYGISQEIIVANLTEDNKTKYPTELKQEILNIAKKIN